MNYSVIIDVVRDEPYGILLEGDSFKRVYGINAHSKKWAAHANGFEHKSLLLPTGMVITASLPMTKEIEVQFADAFGEINSTSRRLERRIKSLLSPSYEVLGSPEVKYPGEFIFGVARSLIRPRKRRRRRLGRKAESGKKIIETKVYPILAVKQKELFRHIYIESKVRGGR